LAEEFKYFSFKQCKKVAFDNKLPKNFEIFCLAECSKHKLG
jgi:hypothetical protein